MAGIPDDESCAQCRYFIDGASECHRNPPSVLLATAVYRSASADKKDRVAVTWPTVTAADWCGQFLKTKPIAEAHQ